VGLTVVSGLARGIDAAAHRGALAAGGRTIAVLANGLAGVYPPEHEPLARDIAAAGAVLSEMPMRQTPLAGLFPQRNRLISGLSLGVVVVEATPRSGSLSTARHALEQNREVFAVPGPVDSLASRGCHALIRDGARLVETVDDILDELGPLVQQVQAAPDAPPVRHVAELALSDHERALLGRLGSEPAGVDELITRTGLSAAQVLATLSVLEMRRLVRRLPGHQFIRA
jgi:DNA processing protein